MIVTELLARFGIELDAKSFAALDKKISGVAGMAGKVLAGAAGLFAVSGIEHFVENLIHVGEELHDTSNKLGVTTKALQEYRLVGQQVGVGQEALDQGFKFLAKSSFDAANGSKEAADAYRRLGLDVKDSNGELKPAEDLLPEIATAMQGLTSNSEKTAIALKIFGRGGNILLPMLNEGGEGIRKMREEAQALGGGFDEELIHNADELGDNLAKLRFSGQSVTSTIGNSLLPVINKGVGVLIDWSKGLQRVLAGSKFLQAGLLILTTLTVGWGIAAVFAARSAIAAWLQAALPFILVAAALTAIALILDDVHALLTGGKSLVGEYLDVWFGVGTADRLVRDWSMGIEILTNNLVSLVSVGGEVAGILGDLFKGDFVNASARMEDLGTRIKNGASAIVDDIAFATDRYLGDVTGQDAMGNDVSPWLTPADQRAAGRGISAAPAVDESTPRANGRGIGARLAEGSAGFGQAAPGSVHPFFRPEVTAPGGEGHGGPSVTQHNETHVTVETHTNANPEEIAQVAGRVVDQKMRDSHRNAREALVNRVPKN